MPMNRVNNDNSESDKHLLLSTQENLEHRTKVSPSWVSYNNPFLSFFYIAYFYPIIEKHFFSLPWPASFLPSSCFAGPST